MGFWKKFKDIFVGKVYSLTAEEYFKVATAKVALNDYVGALRALNKTIELAPGYALAFYHRGMIHGYLGKKQQEAEDLLVAAELFERNGDLEHLKSAKSRLEELRQ